MDGGGLMDTGCYPISLSRFMFEDELFARAIADEMPVPTTIEDAVANIKVIEAVLRSAGSGSFERV